MSRDINGLTRTPTYAAIMNRFDSNLTLYFVILPLVYGSLPFLRNGGDGWIRTSVKGFADPCLATRLRRPMITEPVTDELQKIAVSLVGSPRQGVHQLSASYGSNSKRVFNPNKATNHRRRRLESNPCIKVLQTSAFPFGYAAYNPPLSILFAPPSASPPAPDRSVRRPRSPRSCDSPAAP
jgi:hypothetical protein